MKIDIDTSQYRMPTQKEVDDAKKYILRRENYAQVLESRVDAILTDAAGRIAQICLKYNIPAKDFTMTSNQKMFQEVSSVMDEVDEEIMALIQQFSTIPAKSESHKHLLLLWIATLGRGNMNLQQTLDGYLNRYLYDLEALVAAYKLRMEKYPSLKQSTVIAQIKSAQRSVYTTPAVVSAMRGVNQMQARYIRTHGVHRDNIPLPIVGRSSSNANNVISMAKQTMQMAWMRELVLEAQDDDSIVGYYVSRGSSYDCPYCDSRCGFTPISNLDNLPPAHGSCRCYAIPIYNRDKEAFT